ncbi:actin nucleation-promoting factor WAS-like [Equus przewalskii]|uniref:Actin nucleation-promoting factor WAS-like n=1 Tax=Equus przewalskii TaxID=9798 RepID=A0ABM4JIK7_EQUPR
MSDGGEDGNTPRDRPAHDRGPRRPVLRSPILRASGRASRAASAQALPERPFGVGPRGSPGAPTPAPRSPPFSARSGRGRRPLVSAALPDRARRRLRVLAPRQPRANFPAATLGGGGRGGGGGGAGAGAAPRRGGGRGAAAEGPRPPLGAAPQPPPVFPTRHGEQRRAPRLLARETVRADPSPRAPFWQTFVPKTPNPPARYADHCPVDPLPSDPGPADGGRSECAAPRGDRRRGRTGSGSQQGDEPSPQRAGINLHPGPCSWM